MGAPASRDEDWFTRIYAEHYALIVNYGRRRRMSADAADELAQEVFVVAWRRREDVPERCLPWLYGVARRLLANQRRSGGTAPQPIPVPDLEAVAARSAPARSTARVAVSPAAPPGAGGTDSDRLADVHSAMARLSDLDQEILRLVGWEELTVGEAAKVLGCTGTTAAVRLHRARRRLVKALAAAAQATIPAPSRARSRAHASTPAPVMERIRDVH